jgi:glycosyltransferase involved in cell wall biosynthesis
MLGKPTICTDWIGIRDYVADSFNGLLVKMGDVGDLRSKMLKLENDKQLRNQLSAGARSWSKQNVDTTALKHTFDDLVTLLVKSSS